MGGAGVGLLLVACSGGQASSPTSTRAPRITSPSTTSTTTTVPAEVLPEGHFFRVELREGLVLSKEEQAVVDAYRDAAEAYARAARRPDLGGKGLPKYWTGQLLTLQIEELKRRSSARLATRTVRGKRSWIQLNRVKVKRSAAAVDVCFHDRSVTYDRSTGKLVSDDSKDLRLVYELSLEAGQWRVGKGGRYDGNSGGFECAGQ